MIHFLSGLSIGDKIALWSMLFGIIGVAVAIWTLRRGNLNSSVATVIPLNTELRTLFEDYLAALNTTDFHTFEELQTAQEQIERKLEKLLNVLEIGAAIFYENSLTGVSKILMRDYVERILQILVSDELTMSFTKNLLARPKDYEYIRAFLKDVSHDNADFPSVVR